MSEALSRTPRLPLLRVGVLCNGAELSSWQLNCLSEIEQLNFAQIVLFVRNSPVALERAPAWRRLRTKVASGLLTWRLYERFVVDRKSLALRNAPIEAMFGDVPYIDVQPIAVGRFRQAFGPDALEELQKYELDVLVRFGFGILTGEILDLPKFGIWSFHHGDPKQFRGAPPGFWEIHNGAPVTGVILQRLTETLDGGVVLHAGWFKTNAASYSRSLDRILFGAAHFVARALRELRCRPDDLMKRTPLQNTGPIYRYPRTAAMLRFFGRTIAAKFRNQYNALFRHQQWSVGLVDKRPDELFCSVRGDKRSIEGVHWLAEPAGVFLADPFAVPGLRENVILAEELDWKTGLGQIRVVQPDHLSSARPGLQINSPHHLSYPYTFEDGSETYCVPECASSNKVTLYRLNRKEAGWFEEKTLIDGFPAVDPTIFNHDGQWWLLCTSAEKGANEYLYAWFAAEPTGEWTPHPLNPLKVDVRGARPAGRPFYSDGTLIRPAQDCSHIYGGAITFNRVSKLTPEEFLEEAEGQLLPEAGRYRAGLHTISGCQQTILDGARLRFVSNEFWRSFKKLVQRARA